MKRVLTYWIGFCCGLFSGDSSTDDLLVGKVCPVSYQQQALGILVFSQAWYHSGRQQASYVARDNATGVGVEIHLFTNRSGELELENQANCSRYRMLQVRTTNRRLLADELGSQVDAPAQLLEPFYDTEPLEYGYGVHATPQDHFDKPWQGRPKRASTLAIYDTPFVSDALGKLGQNIEVDFETCVVCQRDVGYDSILSCGRWGYQREFLDERSGWAEPEYKEATCLNFPSIGFRQTVDLAEPFEYQHWLNWR
ncbi:MULTISPECIES: hypothetical protein [unclassified Agarivorans]|uniref:hypothetical protein n=1 Tax=unclassified Agarivorans TaxID=2636026 RepID=UPI003D7DD74A